MTTPVHRPFLPPLYGSCERMIEAPIREALAAAQPEASGIDIACNEGWFAHRCSTGELGASSPWTLGR